MPSILFHGWASNKRMPLSGVVSVCGFDNGVIVTPSRGKQQIFLMPDAMFAATNFILKSVAL